MAQIPHVNNTLKPITLLIAPQVPTVVQPMEVQKMSVGNHGVITLPQVPIGGIIMGSSLSRNPVPISGTILSSPMSTVQVPISRFNHTPTTPIGIGMTLEEKERRRIEKHKEQNNRYRDKTKHYTKLASLATDREKIYALLLLCRPELTNIDKLSLEIEIERFLRSLQELK